ncbi:CD3324 family protein [Candidatus Merdisoma sp. JLR.KK006]|uniref:CD3324 family protein n=1 Tax=Candidatus Merdisoma sp. JLR.KK006 TaxID=3112626 RepID=UPI002FF19211
MKYMNANEILPAWLVEELQRYMQAGYIYIPAKTEQHKSWGELSGYRKELEKRNKKIISEYKQGVSMEELAEYYHLSVYAIRKIIYQR